MREKRKGLSGKERLKQNLLAKKGMRELKSDGPIRIFSKRDSKLSKKALDIIFDAGQRPGLG